VDRASRWEFDTQRSHTETHLSRRIIHVKEVLKFVNCLEVEVDAGWNE